MAVFNPPAFTRANARQFHKANCYFILEGNADRLQIIAEELRDSLGTIIALAAKLPQANDEKRNGNIPPEQVYAYEFLLLIADRRFCRTVVEKVPAFALICIETARKYPSQQLPIYQFARNIGQEFIRNTDSSFYQEDSRHHSGLVGYAQPVTKNVFGSFEFVEKCATDGASPLDTEGWEFEFNAKQMAGYSRAALAFFESYLEKTNGRSHPHSYALSRMLSSFKYSLHNIHQLNGMEDYSGRPEYGAP